MNAGRDRIAEYFERRYDNKEGSPAEHVKSLFDEVLVFHLTGDKTMGRPARISLCELLRRTRHDPVTTDEELEEDGDSVALVPHIAGRDRATRHEVSVSTRTKYRFPDDKVVEVRQEDLSQVAQAVRAAGVRL